ncbi:MAG: hypothetical protein JXA71_05250 [Chitinispirillaceae bacterium]|nr:hypothetical protein [Chitinispirillaceae bacterium]
MRSARFMYGITLVSCILLFFGCKTKDLGAAIPADAPQVKLAQVMASPAEYNGKKVVMKGIVSAQCPSLCEFTYKEGTHSTLIFPQGFKFPKLPLGKPVTLFAEVTSGTGQVVVTAHGLKME